MTLMWKSKRYIGLRIISLFSLGMVIITGVMLFLDSINTIMDYLNNDLLKYQRYQFIPQEIIIASIILFFLIIFFYVFLAALATKRMEVFDEGISIGGSKMKIWNFSYGRIIGPKRLKNLWKRITIPWSEIDYLEKNFTHIYLSFIKNYLYLIKTKDGTIYKSFIINKKESNDFENIIKSQKKFEFKPANSIEDQKKGIVLRIYNQN
jgi:hypothetical protein